MCVSVCMGLVPGRTQQSTTTAQGTKVRSCKTPIDTCGQEVAAGMAACKSELWLASFCPCCGTHVHSQQCLRARVSRHVLSAGKLYPCI